jgi:hypothetical protein
MAATEETTTTHPKLEALAKELTHMSRLLRDLQTDDYEGHDALTRSLAHADSLLFEYNLDQQPATEDDELLAA